ncbi:hypothetical protein [Brevibacterium sp. CFH 10365]|uniref:hypothetical protein n=1 Tax=Brevibacterium sp. CFH 10365 TaxID=2585207 RepID=UPI0012667039|nr:hypothetical protein [Brevibacterium sp. CFH 10365]
MKSTVAASLKEALRSTAFTMRQLPPVYWLTAIFHLLVTVMMWWGLYLRIFEDGLIGGFWEGVANTYLAFGILLFPLADYWSAGSSRLLYRKAGSDFASVWDGRRRLSDNLLAVFIVKIVRLALWFVRGSLSLILWPLFCGISRFQMARHMRQLRLVWTLPTRMFRGHLPTDEEVELWNSLYQLKIRNLWAIIKRIDSGRGLDPEQAGWASRFELYAAYENAR